ncbi:TIGR01777 family oxidoreductase [Rhodococcus tibetensis]|uniref:TIGR01777 family oxidoreductase n=1 Tax=Rhodococcus tibetensis TaxID=2965064 RepID=A0ABT1QH74_9NOCA|nr:TIGR01777 family oxidoreductase [Rhodococcus sp. FXJ9.536]MCQ4121140.1 TIGR01777 family oxidoreductase [Rhodococcus sp. FXJ9.536]
MGIVHSSVIRSARDELFAWHTRPGAFTRLAPPWQPLSLVKESESLQSGRAESRLPGGLRWIAQHDAHEYDPPRQFVDYSAALPMRVLVPWRHTHSFEVVSDSETRMTDRVETAVPGRLLTSTFVYRHRQVADDVARHQWADTLAPGSLTIAVTGSSGLVGTALTAFLSTGGHRVVRLVRRTPRTPDERRWNPDAPAADLLTGVDAVIHLAGASIAGRFTESHRRIVRESRIEPTRRLAELTATTADGPKIFVTASAIGYYGPDRGDELLHEDDERGEGFLADTVADWEGASTPASEAGVRVVSVRTGIVQSPNGGVLRLQRPLFEVGLGGRLGSGTQWLSWIDLDDLVDVYHRAVVDTELTGPVNAVAPNPVRNEEYTSVLASVLHRPAFLPVPDLGPKLLLGEQGARELALADQRVTPGRLLEREHRFRRPDLESALRHQLGRFKTGV